MTDGVTTDTQRLARFVAVHDETGTRIPLDPDGGYVPTLPGRWHIETEEIRP